MRLRLIQLIIFFSVHVVSVSAQTGNYTMFGNGFAAFLDNSRISIVSGLNHSTGKGVTKSNYDGSLDFYFSDDHLYSSDGVILGNAKARPLTTNLNEAALVELNDSTFLIFSSSYDTVMQTPNHQVYYHQISKVNGTIELEKEKIPFFNRPVYGMVTIEDTAKGTWLVTRINENTFKSYYFSQGCFACEEVTSTIPLKLKNFSLNTLYYYIKRSPSGNFLAIVGEESEVDPIRKIRIGHSVDIHSLRFDKQTGSIVLLDTLLHHSNNSINSPNQSWYEQPIVELCSDDNTAYVGYLIRNKEGKNNNIENDSFKIIKTYLTKTGSNRLVSQVPLNSKTPAPVDLKLFNDGNIYVLNRDWLKREWVFDQIQNPTKSNLNFHQRVYSKSAGYSLGAGQLFSYSKYNFIRSEPQIEYSCSAVVTFKENSDFSLPNTQITYYVADTLVHGRWINVGPRPQLNYKKNGDYRYKIVLRSKKGNYDETHHGIFRVRIPEKPIAAFYCEDSVICRFYSTRFRNTSWTKEKNPLAKPKYHWTFGDGSSSSEFEPYHSYNHPGVYTVSLYYHNGYCDSTLISKDMIKVVEAPAPGFDIDNNRGCAPFTVSFQDTVTENVLKKEYYFSDLERWEEIRNTKFSHTFDSAGTYYVVQRLYGFNGCVTQVDTMRIYVSRGVTTADSVQVKGITFDGGENIKLNWKPLIGAVKYKVLSGIKLNSLHSIQIENRAQITDSLAQPIAKYYTVIGIDSCGATSSPSNPVRPILLTGKVSSDNEYAVLSYTAYLYRRNESIEYGIQTIDDEENAQTLAYQSDTDSYLDNEFLSEGKVQKCYRISATISKQNTKFISNSNTICLEYKPLVWLPNAISPNGDNLNDEFAPVTYGITHYELSVFNTWGQLIYSSSNSSWKPTSEMTGVYTYKLILQTVDGKWIYSNGTVTVLR